MNEVKDKNGNPLKVGDRVRHKSGSEWTIGEFKEGRYLPIVLLPGKYAARSSEVELISPPQETVGEPSRDGHTPGMWKEAERGVSFFGLEDIKKQWPQSQIISTSCPPFAFGKAVAVTVGDESKENARRIVACVNALAGVSTEPLEAGALKELLRIAEHCASSPNVYMTQEDHDSLTKALNVFARLKEKP